MIQNFFKTAVRNFLRNSFYSAINVFGLSIGITCAILIFSIIRFELSYDEDQDAENIYRVITEQVSYGELGSDTGVPNPFTSAFRDDFPEAKYVTIIDGSFRNPVFSVDNNSGISKFFEAPVYVDPDFFKMFRLKWIEGSPEAAHPNKNSVVISRSVANKYFGRTNVVGETILQDSEDELTITGVAEDFPENSSFDFTIFLPYAAKFDEPNNNWNSTSSATQCFLTLHEDADPEDVEYRLTDFLFKYKAKGANEERTRLYLQKLSEVHFDTNIGFTFTRIVEERSIYALGLIGVFLILTASINFINLNTVQVVKRAKEIGIRKVMGGRRSGLILQFFSETSLITLASVFLSLGLVELSLIHIDKLLGYSLEFGSWLQPGTLIFILVLFVTITILSGWYPAMVLSGFQPAQALKKKLASSSKSSLGLRRVLVILQFVISQVLIVCTIIVGMQMNYFNNTPMGFNKEAIIEVKLQGYEKTQLQSFKNELLEQTAIKNLSYSNTSASSGNIWGGSFRYYNGDEEIREEAQVKWVDHDFAKTYGLEIIAGEDLLPGDTTNSFLVNEEFLNAIGASSPEEVIGNFINMWGEQAPVMGVVKDFFSASMHEKITPVVIGIRNQYAIAGIKVSTNDLQGTLVKIEQIYNKVFPRSIFEYDFLDDRIKEYYEDEQRESILFSTFSIIAIAIGCLGLLGLVSFMAQQRVKEVGIRKVFGASIAHLLGLFTREFVVLILIAFILATPVSYFAMEAWLADFPYHIDINVWVFILAGGISIFIAVFTVGYKSYSAASANPVDVLRDE
jgi:ABC-type antimicrobial peptide transport system permease subunit